MTERRKIWCGLIIGALCVCALMVGCYLSEPKWPRHDFIETRPQPPTALTPL